MCFTGKPVWLNRYIKGRPGPSIRGVHISVFYRKTCVIKQIHLGSARTELRARDTTHTHTHARTHARMHARTHARTHTHTNTHTCSHTHTHTHARTHARTHAHTHTNTNTNARTHARTYARTHARTYTRTHTYTHTCIGTHKAHTSCQFTAQKALPTFQHRLRCFPPLVTSKHDRSNSSMIRNRLGCWKPDSVELGIPPFLAALLLIF